MHKKYSPFPKFVWSPRKMPKESVNETVCQEGGTLLLHLHAPLQLHKPISFWSGSGIFKHTHNMVAIWAIWDHITSQFYYIHSIVWMNLEGDSSKYKSGILWRMIPRFFYARAFHGASCADAHLKRVGFPHTLCMWQSLLSFDTDTTNSRPLLFNSHKIPQNSRDFPTLSRTSVFLTSSGGIIEFEGPQ